MGAAQHQRINALADQGRNVLLQDPDDFRVIFLQMPGFDQRHQFRTGPGIHFRFRQVFPDRLGIGAAADRCPGGRHSDLSVPGCIHCSPGRDIDHPVDRHRRMFRHLPAAGRIRRVAGNDHRRQIKLFQDLGVMQGQGRDLFPGLFPVRHVQGITEKDNIDIRLPGQDAADNRQSAQAGIKDTDVFHRSISHISSMICCDTYFAGSSFVFTKPTRLYTCRATSRIL